MKKIYLIACMAALATTGAMAQTSGSAATAGTPLQTQQEANKAGSPTTPADIAQQRVDARKDGATATMGAGKGAGKAGRWSKMDANGDGMVSQQEYTSYHANRWSSMKHKDGMVSMQDMEAAMEGPN